MKRGRKREKGRPLLDSIYVHKLLRLLKKEKERKEFFH